MNLYDVLRTLVGKAALPETVANDCMKVIDETERWNALGTTVKAMETDPELYTEFLEKKAYPSDE